MMRFFVTSVVYTGDLGGLSGADAKCQQAADAEGIGGAWRAWLSNTASPAAKDRITGNGPWCTVDGRLLVFKNAANLGTNPHWSPSTTERGESVRSSPYLVWTGTSVGGGASGSACANWATSSSSYYGTGGDAISDDSSWTENDSDGSPCDTKAHLYCFEVEN